MDAVGLGVFTVIGVQCAYRQTEHYTLFLTVFVGLITGVGGGVLRLLAAYYHWSLPKSDYHDDTQTPTALRN